MDDTKKEDLILYLAGRMRGVQYYNFPAFDRARDTIAAMGHRPVSPADIDRAAGFDGTSCAPDDPCTAAPPGFDLDRCIASDVAEILKADGICFIDSAWPESTGARAECMTAIWARKRLFRLEADGRLREITYTEAYDRLWTALTHVR